MTLSNLATHPLDQLGQYLHTGYLDFAASAPVRYAEVANKYYDGENDILGTRIMYINNEGDPVEDTTATNTRIAHGFFPELVDQKVQYILGDEGVEVHPTEEDDTKLEELLDEYFTDDWQLTMQELIEGASVKGFEGLFARTTTDDSLRFQIADALHLVPIFDEYGKLVRILRFYNERRYSSEKQKTVIVRHCDAWDSTEVAHYIQEDEGNTTSYYLDPTVAINPAPHIIAQAENPDYIEGESDESERWLPLGRSYDAFPFHILNNNRRGVSDLSPIKDIIDDYDLMNCFMSNNLQDMTEAFYVIRGAENEPLDKIKQNIKSRKAVKVRDVDGAGVDVHTYNIPVEGRSKKMELDEVNIYRAGMGFNSQQLGDGNITNVVIQSRYTLLNMKAAKLITRLKACLKWQAELVVADINRKNGTAYVASDICFDIEPKAIINESALILDKKTEAETEQLKVQTVLQIAPRIGDDETLRLICEQFDLDFDEVQGKLEDEEAQGAGEGVVDPMQFLPQNNPVSAAKAVAGQTGVDPSALQGNPPADNDEVGAGSQGGSGV